MSNKRCKKRFGITSRFCLKGGLILFAGLLSASCAKAEGAVPQKSAGQDGPAALFELRATSKIALILPAVSISAEETAAKDLQHYLTQITGASGRVIHENQTVEMQVAVANETSIYVGNTNFAKRAGINGKTLPSENWRIKTEDKNLILVGGGTRGTLYATYHFLEDYAGVRWWTPWEETVPSRRVLQIPALNENGQPVFAYRDINFTYGAYYGDEGRFAIRNRLNAEGSSSITTRYGGGRNYGPPFLAHTTYLILPPDKYFADHPEWYIGVPKGEKPDTRNSQLAMSNPEMRAEFLKNLKIIIRKSYVEARAKNLPLPDVFCVSQEDNLVKFETPADKQLLAENDGAESAILLSFINYLADGIKDEFPDAFVDTLAYYSGEKAPKTVRPRDNVIIRLTDTTSNLIEPVTALRNHEFRENLEAWGKITKNMRVWDYAVTYAYPGMPMPTEYTYPIDLKFWKDNNVEGIFVEHEFPILADRRDFKIWLQCKLFEDPYQDYDKLVQEFTDGFYGPAGESVRTYFKALESEAKAVGEQGKYEDISWAVSARPYNYLSLDAVLRAHNLMDEAERAVRGNEMFLRRVRHARMSLDRYTALFYRYYLKKWQGQGHTIESFPLERDKIVTRYLKSWNEQIDLRLPEQEREDERKRALADAEGAKNRNLPIPREFANLPLEKVEVYGASAARNAFEYAKVIEDGTSEVGSASRLLIDDLPEADRNKYQLPISGGVYDTVGAKGTLTAGIKAQDVPGPGYHWYKMGETKLTGNDFIYLFWSWIIQFDIGDAFDSSNPDQISEVWASLKFEGPMFNQPGEKNAISVDRFVVVRK